MLAKKKYDAFFSFVSPLFLNPTVFHVVDFCA